MKTKQQNQRYYLHRVVRNSGFKVNARAKVVGIPDGLPVVPKQVQRLHKQFNYSLQVFIPG